MFCNPYHKLSLKIESHGNDVAVIEKPFMCCCPALLPCCLKEATIFRINNGSREEVGYLRQPYFGGCIEPVIDVFNKKGGELNGKVKGPCLCLGGFCSSNFKFYDAKGFEHAKIKRDGVAQKGILRSSATTSDRYELSFEDNSLQLDGKCNSDGRKLTCIDLVSTS